MTITQAVSSVLGQYAGFRGRARRAEFWWWNLFTLLVGVAVAVAELALGIGDETGGPVSTLVAIALLVPNLTVCVRRLHDSSRSGWWLLVALVPLVGLVVLLVFFLAPSTPGENRHGPDPTQPAEAPEVAPGWTPPGWDLPSAAEPEAGRPAQDQGGHDDGQERPPG